MSDKDTNTPHVSDDALDAMPSIMPEREDIDSRRGRHSTIAKGGKTPDGREAGAKNAGSAHSSGSMTKGLMALCVVTLAAVLYLLFALQQTRQSLAAATARVAHLEERLVTTDTSLTKSEVLLAAKLKAMDTLLDNHKQELNKLANLGDKQARALQSQTAELQQQKLQLKNTGDQLKQTVTQVASDSALLTNLGNTSKETAQRMEIVQENLSDLNADTNALKSKQSALESDTGKRLTALEDTAKSTDVFRRNTLDELRKLREELNKPALQPAVGTKPAP